MMNYRANQTLLASTVLSADRSSAAIPMEAFSRLGLQVDWDDLIAGATSVAASGVLTAGAGELTITALEKGTAGNSISVALTAGGTAGSEVVTVVGNAITVQVENGVSTAAQVKDALDASPEAAALISVAVTAAGAMAAPDSVTLSGGTQGTIDASIKIYVSNTGLKWDLATTAIAVSTSTGTECVGIEDIVFTFMKVVVEKGAVTGGTVSVTGTFRE
jgi:hypothetical protein